MVVTAEFLTFQVLAGVAAVAVCVGVSAVLHIVGRGMWLGLSKGTAPAEACDRFCNWTYKVAVFLLLYLLFLIISSFAFNVSTLGIKRLLLYSLHTSAKAADYIALGATGGLGSLLISWLGRSIFRKIEWQETGMLMSYVTVIVVSSIMGGLTVESCYTLDLRSNTVLCDRDRQDILEADVTLGGATSDPQYASVNLLDSKGGVLEKLPLQAVGEGHYISHLMSSRLAEGAYSISLEYPHISLRASYPFILSQSRKSTGFVVVRSSMSSPTQATR
jgi:hypothetical protein